MPPRIAVLLDRLREDGFSDEEVRRVQLALSASSVELVSLAVEIDLHAEYARHLPPDELLHLAASNPRAMYEDGWLATVTLRGRTPSPATSCAVLLFSDVPPP
jgi:hypothetical protein